MINKVLLEGRIVKDFELRTVGDGKKVALFVIANTNTARKDKRTDFIPCIAFGKQAEIATQYLGKGSLVSVEGALYVDTKKTDTGELKMYFNVQCHRIHFLEYKNKDNASKEKEMVMTMELDEELQQDSGEEMSDALNEFLVQTEASVFDEYPF